MNRSILILVVLCCSICTAWAAEDILINDFESDTYGDWAVTGEAFGPGPSRGKLPGQMDNMGGYEGTRLANSFNKGDDSTGTLSSPTFKIQRKYINFLIGGGHHPKQACINLLSDGNIVRTTTGPNDQPGGTEALDWESWDVSDLIGKTVRIQIVDNAKGGWGHINIDHIVQSDKKVTSEKTREILLTKKYLNLPVRTGAAKRKMSLIIDGVAVREFTIELADNEPEFWYFLDVSSFKDKQAIIKLNTIGANSKGLANITPADKIIGLENLYNEKNRQQFHFSSRRGWNNDSNGLVYYKGEYHLYYQSNPYGWAWGNMHWAHAVSTDLVHWKELPIAIYPHSFGDWVFSGSAVVDKDNTAGFKTGAEDVIVAAYTSTGRGEAIAYSNDRGRTFTDYKGNPVVKHSGRDPKVIWYEPGKHWVMALYSDIDKKRTIAFYNSTDLKNWTYQSNVPDFYECPEIFELAVDGDKSKTKWVIYGASGDYMIGDFNGKEFSPDGDKIRFHYGNCFYASQTYNNIPEEDGRRIQIAWGRIETPGMGFNQCMLFPVVLTLQTTDDGIRMFAEPVREIESLHRKKHSIEPSAINGQKALSRLKGDLFHIDSEFTPADAEEFGFVIRGTEVTYNAKTQTLSCKDKTANLKPTAGKIKLEILVDRNSIEIFANDGRIYMPIGGILPEDNKSIELFSNGGKAKIELLNIYELNSAWK